MKIPQGMKTKLGGNFLSLLAALTVAFLLGTAFGVNLFKTQYETDYYLLPREYYDCWVGMLLPDEQQTKVCVVYRAKGINFEGNNLPRHREYNKEQGKRIHEF